MLQHELIQRLRICGAQDVAPIVVNDLPALYAQAIDLRQALEAQPDQSRRMRQCRDLADLLTKNLAQICGRDNTLSALALTSLDCGFTQALLRLVELLDNPVDLEVPDRGQCASCVNRF